MFSNGWKLQLWMRKFFNNTPTSVRVQVPADEVIEQVVPQRSSLSKMTKKELEELGREKGIELDGRKTKQRIIDDLLNHLKG